MLTDFRNSPTGLAPRLKRVATLPREMVVLKNRHAPDLSGAPVFSLARLVLVTSLK